ncbi:endoglucanase 15-like [Nylanderia fulva]|uniref:endoglucanase 15-like n=1 Tax=Nylanderia fulva TaxID=613905 RepID=UPI0010FB968A|nr:endoglucanase 15-like [Nylanderia fulva]XP_029163088.1 endoglucanase 15-like [Nylanderia fulva]XP_029163089.1 endoglucanase 15-like [Nylanderia fulva]XP_029163090.1 endoglucanase 15-like [Nylanderia fulva]
MKLDLFVTCVTILPVILIISTCRINAFTIDSKKVINNSYDYAEVTKLSLLFFEAQRSGKLPKDNRIPWRGDSALNDCGSNHEDLSGGYYDAADFVKFSFTMAFTTTILSWGVISWPEAYVAANQSDEILKTIKWATDYFIKCHVSKNVLYGQVGDFTSDQMYWGRPEEMNMCRPAYKIDAEHPGSDLAGETAAALAASSIVFKNVDLEYSIRCLKHAIELYEFADTYRGFYLDAISNAKDFFKSEDYGDELAWAALWLSWASRDPKYLEYAFHHYQNFNLDKRPNEFFYNNKVAGVQVLLAQLGEQSEHQKAARAFCDFSVQKQKRTPKGLLFINKTGTLSHAANVAFLCLEAADSKIGDLQLYRQFAKEQIDYILGSTGKSYVVGYGENSPKQPLHAASSCPDRPAPCGWADFDKNESNPQILYGALVSGPNENDKFHDQREEDLYTEVLINYNAGFTSALVGLLQLQLKDEL